jgi:hypothetical protein
MELDDCFVEQQWMIYTGVHCLRGNKPLIVIRQIMITYYHNLPYLKISQYTLTQGTTRN